MLIGAVSIVTVFMVGLLFLKGAQRRAISKEHQTEPLHTLIHSAYTLHTHVHACTYQMLLHYAHTKQGLLKDIKQLVWFSLPLLDTDARTHHELCSALEESELPTNGAAVMPA